MADPPAPLAINPAQEWGLRRSQSVKVGWALAEVDALRAALAAATARAEKAERDNEEWKRGAFCPSCNDLTARAEKAKQDLAWYGRHFDWCQLTHSQLCTCGLDALLAPPGEGATP